MRDIGDIKVFEDISETDKGTETSPEPPIISRGSVWTSLIGRGSLVATGVGPSPRRRCGTPVNLPLSLAINYPTHYARGNKFGYIQVNIIDASGAPLVVFEGAV